MTRRKSLLLPSITTIDTIANSWCRRNRPESMSTDWGQSLLAAGLAAAWRRTGNAAAAAYLRRWLSYHLSAGIHPNYFVGSWSVGLVYPTALDLMPEHDYALRNTASRIYDFILRKSLRNADGVILHNVDLPHIYIDTLFYTIPVLARLGAVLGCDKWRQVALDQLDAHLEILRDTQSGMYIHCQENISEHRSQGAWGRGNGWVALTCVELMEHSPKRSREYRRAATALGELLDNLLPMQTRSGLWRTILNDRTSYEETSASAMFLSALLRARRQGFQTPAIDLAIERAARGLLKYVDAKGKFIGASEGTWPGTVEYYKGLAQGEWWWGTGAALLAFDDYVEG